MPDDGDPPQYFYVRAEKIDEKSPFLPYKKVFEDTAKVRQLAIKYCSTCHLFPEPNLLGKKRWTQSVLPNMAMRLDIREPGKNP